MRASAARKRILDDDDVGAIYDDSPPKKCFRTLSQGMRVLNASLASNKQGNGPAGRGGGRMTSQTAGAQIVHSSVATAQSGPYFTQPINPPKALGGRRLSTPLGLDLASRRPNLFPAQTPQSGARQSRATKTASVIRPFAGIAVDTARRVPQSQVREGGSLTLSPFHEQERPSSRRDLQSGYPPRTAAVRSPPPRRTMLDLAVDEPVTSALENTAGADKYVRLDPSVSSRGRGMRRTLRDEVNAQEQVSVFSKSRDKGAITKAIARKGGTVSSTTSLPKRFRARVQGPMTALSLDIGLKAPAMQPRSDSKPAQSTTSKLKLKKDRTSGDVATPATNVDIRRQALNSSETTIVKSATIKVPQDKIVAEVKEANIVLRGEDIVRLRGRRWLNDEVINSFVALINVRNKKYFANQGKSSSDTSVTPDRGCDVVEVSSPTTPYHHREEEGILRQSYNGLRQPGRPRTYAFNTFFHTRLCKNSYDYKGVRKWPERAGIDIASLDLVLVPVNLDNYHWVLAAVDIRDKELIYFDSLYGGDDLGVLEALGRWLFDEIHEKHGLKQAESMQIPSWTRTVNPSYLPRQRDDGSCGLFTLYTADYLELGRIPDYSQDDMTVLRQRAILFLTRGSLPET
jgi:hypothetical protein